MESIEKLAFLANIEYNLALIIFLIYLLSSKNVYNYYLQTKRHPNITFSHLLFLLIKPFGTTSCFSYQVSPQPTELGEYKPLQFVVHHGA